MTRTKSTFLALLAVLLSPMAANAVPITLQGTFDGYVTSSYDHLGITFGEGHGSGLQVNWQIIGTFSYQVDLGVADQLTQSDWGRWYDTSLSTEWSQISVTFIDTAGVERGTFTPNSSPSYSPPDSVGIDQLFVDDHQETAENGYRDDPTERFSLRDGFSSPRLSPVPDPLIYQEEKVEFSLLGSHYHQDFITGDGMVQEFIYDRDLWTYGFAEGSYSFLNKVEDTGTVSDYEYRFNGDFVLFNIALRTESVPEPSTLALFGIGLLGMRLARRKKKV